MDDTETTTLLKERYETLPTPIRELFDFDVIERFMAEISVQFNLSTHDQVQIENEIALTLLFFFPSYNISDRLLKAELELEPSQIPLVVSSIQNELFFMVEDVLEATDERFRENQREIETKSVEPATGQASSDTEKQSSSSQRQKDDLTTQLERLRTMQQDADRIHGYGAYRRKYQTPEGQTGQTGRDPLANLPKYEDK